MAYLIATQTIHVAAKKGEPVRTILAGTPVDESDPAVKANPGVFKPAEEIASRVSPTFGPVEQATAAPGEKRAVRRQK